MSVVMTGRRGARRRGWILAGVVAVAAVAAGVLAPVLRDRGEALGGAVELAVARAQDTAREARYQGEARVPTFADPREAFVRGPLQDAVQAGLPDVTLVDAACRTTLCRLTYETADEFSGLALVHAPWPGGELASIRDVGGPQRIELWTRDMPAELSALATWFRGVTAGRELGIELARGRIEPHVVDLAVAWQRAHRARR